MARPTHVSVAPGVESALARNDAGVSLIEALVTMVLIAFLMLSIAQLIGASVLAHKASDDVTQVTAFAEQKLEELRNLDYDALTAGGSIAADVGGFFETEDIDGDGNDDFRRRWLVTDNGTSKDITVFSEAIRAVSGPAKNATLFALVANP